MNHLIANTGIQFICQEIEFNPSQPLAVSNGEGVMSNQHPLIVNMYEHLDPFSMQRMFDFLVQSNDGNSVPLHELIDNSTYSFGNQSNQLVKLNPDGTYVLDGVGLPIIRDDVTTALLTTVTSDANTVIHTIPTLDSYRVHTNTLAHVPAIELLLNKWIPIPLYECVEGSDINSYPTGWCRVKIEQIESGKSNNKYRLIFAIDTTTAIDSLSTLQPYFFANSQGEHNEEYKNFKICDEADKLQDFFFRRSNDLDGTPISTLSSESSYFAQLLNIQNTANMANNEDGTLNGQFKYLAYYAYLIMFLRHTSGLNVRLYNPNMRGIAPIGVDLVLDIGNSKTCGILFEEGDFTKREMLSLRDLTNPWKVYHNSFDMRVVFRQADFGNDIGIDGGEHMFQWRSLLRIGEEANALMHISRESDGLASKYTNYSSPKRYIWDTEKFFGNWEFLQIDSDPLQNRIVKTMYMDGVTNYLSEDGSFCEEEGFTVSSNCNYSRCSLMMNVFLEIFRQAEHQINSEDFRNRNAQINRPRRLRNIVITAPTAMPNEEQVRLRRLAQDAFNLMCKDGIERNAVTIVPSPDCIKARSVYSDGIQNKRDWIYDEATACQLVYLYAEIQKRYGGDARTFLELKGTQRADMATFNFDTPVITIGSIDVGAGTTDLMICSYGVSANNKIVPVPIFWDSFNLAGDDILRSIVQCLILDGEHLGDENRGTISSVLYARLKKLSNAEFLQKRNNASLDSHRIDLDNILNANDDIDRNVAIEKYAQDLMIDCFSIDTGNNMVQDRKWRVDFNAQISVPLASYFLQLLSEDRPMRSLSFSDIFENCRPATHLLERFKEKFGFDFESIVWEYNPKKLNNEIRKVMTPLMEQLSILLHAYNVDIAMLAGRPTKLTALTDLFLKFYPVSPDRLVRLPKYEVGNWYPFAHGRGTITDQKTIVAVGAYIGFLASKGDLNGFTLDISVLASRMGATANYIGKYLPLEHRVAPVFLTPTTQYVHLTVPSFPFLIGCKQLNTEAYESRPLYVVDWDGSDIPANNVTIILTRSYQDDKEKLSIDDAFDSTGKNCKASIKLRKQSMVDTESGKGNYWLDDGAFKFLSK